MVLITNFSFLAKMIKLSIRVRKRILQVGCIVFITCINFIRTREYSKEEETWDFRHSGAAFIRRRKRI